MAISRCRLSTPFYILLIAVNNKPSLNITISGPRTTKPLDETGVRHQRDRDPSHLQQTVQYHVHHHSPSRRHYRVPNHQDSSHGDQTVLKWGLTEGR